MVIDAIDILQRHLESEWIAEGCAEREYVAGCVSCFMARLHQDLDALRYEIETNELASKGEAAHRHS
jgi:hypothetical protein